MPLNLRQKLKNVRNHQLDLATQLSRNDTMLNMYAEQLGECNTQDAYRSEVLENYAKYKAENKVLTDKILLLDDVKKRLEELDEREDQS